MHNQDDDQHMKLPLKTKTGLVPVKVQAITTARSKQEEEEEDEEAKEQEAEEEADEEGHGFKTLVGAEEEHAEPEALGAAAHVARHRRLEEQRRAIAEMCMAVIEDPQNQLSKLKELRGMCDGPQAPCGGTTSVLAMLSLATVFKDITPGCDKAYLSLSLSLYIYIYVKEW